MKNREYVQEVFQYLHTNPEIGFEEYKTAAFLAEELKKCGYEVKEKVGGSTGVIGILDSGIPGPVLGLRGDMDALQYEIDKKIEFRHTCGHDSHCAMVLAAAKEVMEQGIKKGKLYILFQPAEEKLTGSLTLINSGLIDDITEVMGIHIRPKDDTSIGHASPAVYHGSSAPVRVIVKGLSAHGARPHLGINAVDAAVLAVNGINAIRANPRIFHSIKVTQLMVGGGSMNIIPDQMTMTIDVRCQDNEEMKNILGKIELAVKCSVQAIGATAEIEVLGCVPAAIYHEEMKAVAREAIKEVLGEEGLLPDMFNPGGEDFHFIAERLGCKAGYIGLGADATPGLHHKDMEFNHDALYHGVEILYKIVEKRLG